MRDPFQEVLTERLAAEKLALLSVRRVLKEADEALRRIDDRNAANGSLDDAYVGSELQRKIAEALR